MRSEYKQGGSARKEIRVVHLSPTDLVNESRIERFNNAQQRLCVEENYIYRSTSVGFTDGIDGNSTTILDVNSDCVKRVLIKRRRPRYLGGLLGRLLEVLRKQITSVQKIGMEKPDIVVLHNFGYCLVGIYCRYILNAHVIYEAHELEIGDNRSFKKRLLVLASEYVLRTICQADIIVVNEASRLVYNALYSPNRIFTIPNVSIDRVAQINQDSSQDRDVRGDCCLDSESFLIVYIGAFQRGRCLLEAIELIERISINNKRLHFALVGYGPLKAELIKKANSTDFMHVLEPVPEFSISDYVKTADMSLVLADSSCLNDYLCLPNKFFQSVKAYLPIASFAGIEVSRLVLLYKLGIEICSLKDCRVLEDFIADISSGRFTVRRANVDKLLDSYCSDREYDRLFQLGKEVVSKRRAG